MYADQVIDNVPMFTDKIVLHTNQRGIGCPNFLATPAATTEHTTPCALEDVEEIVSVPDIPVEDPSGGQASDIFTRRRSMSKRALLQGLPRRHT